MSELIAAIENSGLAVWIRESPSVVGYTLVLSVHVVGLALVIGISTVIALRLLGAVSELPLAPLQRAFPLPVRRVLVQRDLGSRSARGGRIEDAVVPRVLDQAGLHRARCARHARAA